MSIRKKQQPDDWEGCEEGYHIYARHYNIHNPSVEEFNEIFIGRFDETKYHEFLWDTFHNLYHTVVCHRPEKHLPSIGSYIDIAKFRRDYEIEGCVIEEGNFYYVFVNS